MRCSYPAGILALFLLSSSAGAASRDDLINEIESAYIASALISADSPMLDMMLAPAKAANSAVAPDVWLSVKTEVAKSFTQIFTAKGSTMDIIIRQSLQSFSDKELQTLDQILHEPVYKRFQNAVASPATQKQMFDGMMKASSHLIDVINTVLEKHQLKGFH
jgi:hypothetical protein